MKSSDLELEKVNKCLRKLSADERSLIKEFSEFKSSVSSKEKNLPYVESEVLTKKFFSVTMREGSSDKVCLYSKVARVYLAGANSEFRVINYLNLISDSQTPVTAYGKDDFYISFEAEYELCSLGINAPKTELESFILRNAMEAIAGAFCINFRAFQVIYAYAQEKGYIPRTNDAEKNSDSAQKWLKRNNYPYTLLEILFVKLRDLNLNKYMSVAEVGSRASKKSVLKKQVCIVPTNTDQRIQDSFQYVFDGITKEYVEGARLFKGSDFSLKITPYEKLVLQHSSENFVEAYFQKAYSENPNVFSVTKSTKEVTQELSKFPLNTHDKEVVRTYCETPFSLLAHYSSGKDSPRFYSKGNPIQRIPSKIRRGIKDGYEIDMRSAHYSILKSLDQDGILDAYGHDFSEMLFQEFKDICEDIEQYGTLTKYRVAIAGRTTEQIRPVRDQDKIKKVSNVIKKNHVKGMFKVAVCSAIYGKKTSQMQNDLTKAISKDGTISYEQSFEIARRALKTGLLAKICLCVKTIMEREKITISQLSNKICKIETNLIRAVYDAALEIGFKDITILVHSHDGVTFHAESLVARNKFFFLVQDKLDALNATNSTQIEFVWLSTRAPSIKFDMKATTAENAVIATLMQQSKTKKKKRELNWARKLAASKQNLITCFDPGMLLNCVKSADKNNLVSVATERAGITEASGFVLELYPRNTEPIWH